MEPGARTPSADQDVAGGRRLLLRAFGTPNSVLHEFDFWDTRYEGRRLFSEVLGTFFLVLVAVGGGMVNARFGGDAVPYGAAVVSPALIVAAIILFMGTVSGAHLNPAMTTAFAARGDFPWKRVPAYIVAQFLGAVLATLLLWALIGNQGSAGLTLPGDGISTARSLGPALVLGDWTAWWAYLVGPVAGGIVAVGISYVLRGRGGGRSGAAAARGTLGVDWRPGSRPRS